MKVYLAGPMRGIPDLNFPAFDRVAEALRRLGHECLNPADHDRAIELEARNLLDVSIEPRDLDLRAAFAIDLDYIARHADAICVLAGWETSRGASAEVAVAHALGLPVLPIEGFGAETTIIEALRVLPPSE